VPETANIFERYFNCLEGTQDRHLHFYEIACSPYESPAFRHTVEFGRGKFKIRIIDQFGGKRPVVINLDFVKQKKCDLPYRVTVILDSNVATALHNFRLNSEEVKPDVRDAIVAFLACACKMKFDYNPLFYLIESFCKSTKDNFIRTVTPVITSILHLHCMDEEYFLSDRGLRLKPEAVKYYCEKHKSGTLHDCANKWVNEFIADWSNKMHTEMIEFSYACLLKMVLIHKKDNRGLYYKMTEFEEFMENSLGVRFGRESQLAAFYFAELAGAFINTQANMKIDDAIHDLKATAWDIYLLRQPEFLLHPSYLPELNLAYICTAEHKLAELGSLFAIERIVSNINRVRISPAVSFDLTILANKVGEVTIEKLLEDNAERGIKRMIGSKVKPISEQTLHSLIEDLEVQLSYFCRR
jgi:hypothetical protein